MYKTTPPTQTETHYGVKVQTLDNFYGVAFQQPCFQMNLQQLFFSETFVFVSQWLKVLEVV
jgi:hypothetical protein